MSLEALTTVWKHSKADHGDLLIMLAIADSMNNAGECWLGTDSIARKARLSIRHVVDHLPLLESMGELTVERGKGPKGTNVYRLGPRYWEIGTSGGELSSHELGSSELRAAGMHPILPEPKTPSLPKEKESLVRRGSGAFRAGRMRGAVGSDEAASEFFTCPKCGSQVAECHRGTELAEDCRFHDVRLKHPKRAEA